jgi:hypothetical protein
VHIVEAEYPVKPGLILGAQAVIDVWKSEEALRPFGEKLMPISK